MVERHGRIGRPPSGADAAGTRAAILDVAERVFAEDGLKAARTERIAELVGVTKAMIHYYFGTKQNLYLNVLERVDRQRAEAIDFASLETLEPRAALRQFCERLLQQLVANPRTAPLFALENIQNQARFYERKRTATITVLVRILERGIESGDFRALDARHTAVNVMAVCVHYFNVASNVQSLWRSGVSEGRRAREHAAAALDFIEAAVLQP